MATVSPVFVPQRGLMATVSPVFVPQRGLIAILSPVFVPQRFRWPQLVRYLCPKGFDVQS